MATLTSSVAAPAAAAAWVHTPRYLLRRKIILHLLRNYRPGRFLEIGCGRGELMPWLARRGFEGVGLEIAEGVFPIAEQTVAPYAPMLRVVDDLAHLADEQFQYVFAFEVLEHLEHDREMLRQWRSWLAPEGRFIFSVPAHMNLWTPADDAAGHFRRYEQDGLKRLIEESGFTVERFWSYGFPLRLATNPLQRWRYRARPRRASSEARQQNTLDSSLGSTLRVSRAAALSRLAVESVAHASHLMQLPFRSFDWGDGYLVACRLSPLPPGEG
jgi:SAM-dependent methyltransferase